MDLEHPDISRTLRTGYPNKKVPTAMDTNKNTQLDYIKKSEESQMSLLDLVEESKVIFEKMEKSHGVISFMSDLYEHRINIYKVDDFFEASEGYEIKFKVIEESYIPRDSYIASFNVKNVKYVIHLDEMKMNELEELLDE